MAMQTLLQAEGKEGANYSRVGMQIFVFLIAIFFEPSWSLSKEQGKFDWLGFNKLIDEKKYDEAWAVIKNENPRDDPEIYFHKGVLLGSGLLGIGVRRCEAVSNFEKSQEIGIGYDIGGLNFLYGSDWASIAAHEGERVALFRIGNRLLNSNGKGYFFLMFDELRSVKSSIKYFSMSSQLGYLPANDRLKELKEKYKELDFSKYKKIDIKKILCPVRQYD